MRIVVTGGSGKAGRWAKAIDRARAVLGYEPQHSWRDEMAAPAG